ncbi:MaoC/PaaZ C-terminal domain-containing protein [Arthrobacter sp. 18067]|uniref:MaoC family dehydratase n=1 Tax=Arthrobacter sp. 18067 TaxID=2681413 RepID=UPI00135B868B|nr:MaoC/PaaZ C-terminal domain-containing protein [Arthrobacter sp. 18067]
MNGDAVVEALCQPIYFDDIPLQQVFTTPGRTITEADIIGFAGISGDFNPLHVDEHFARSTPFGGRIAHGLLVLSIASGMTTRLPVFAALQPALLGMTSVTCSWPAPTRIGDTLTIDLVFTEATVTRSGTKGLVTEQRTARNQDGVVVLESTWSLLVARNAGNVTA